MNKLELIKHKSDLIKTKAELKKFDHEYAPYMSWEERDEIEKYIKEIDELIKNMEEAKVVYDLKAFVDIYEANDFVNECAHKGYEIQQMSTSGTGIITILARKTIIEQKGE